MPKLCGDVLTREVCLTAASGSSGSGSEGCPARSPVQPGTPGPGVLGPSSTALMYLLLSTWGANSHMPWRRQMPASCRQPLRKWREPRPHSLVALEVVHMALQCVCRPSSAFYHLSLHFVLDHTWSRHSNQALLPPTGDSLGGNWPSSLPAEQACKPDLSNSPTVGDRCGGSLWDVQGLADFWFLLTPTLLNTLRLIPAFTPDNAYHFKKPSALLHHVDDLKAVLLNYLLINWLSSCQVRSLEAESLSCMICLLLRPTVTNYKHL